MAKLLGIAAAVLLTVSSAAYAQQKQQQPPPDGDEIDFDCWDLFNECVDRVPGCTYGDTLCLDMVATCVDRLNRCVKTNKITPMKKGRPSLLDRF
jgi:hypothetical protein